MLYTDEVVRVSLAQIRGQYRPAGYRDLKQIRLEVPGEAVLVDIVKAPLATCHGGFRRWMVCPRCRARVNVIGYAGTLGWGCARRDCLGWHGRNRRASWPKETTAAPLPE